MPELREFVSKYVALRDAYSNALFEIFPGILNEEMAEYYGKRTTVHIRMTFEFQKLPRTSLTRGFIESAVKAVETAQAADALAWQAYRLRNGGSPGEQREWIALRDEGKRMWRLLDDRIEDAYAPFNPWELRSRPQVP